MYIYIFVSLAARRELWSSEKKHHETSTILPGCVFYGYTLRVPGYIPEYGQKYCRVYALRVPGSMLEYDQNSQVWYPGTPEFGRVYILGVPGYVPRYMTKQPSLVPGYFRVW